MSKCEICKYQKDCPDIVEENSIYCLTHRKIPKNFNNEYISKQPLIKFLEDKIKENNKTLELLEDTGSIRIFILQSQLKALQEFLDFVNNGGKQ